MKLGIEFNDSRYNEKNIDLSCGNDGLGGTQYSILLIAYLYALRNKNDAVVAFHYNEKFCFNKEIKSVILSDDLHELEDEKPDILLTNAYLRSEHWYEILDKNGIKLILLANNFPTGEKMRQFNEKKCLKKIVFKTGQEADAYYDDDLIEKSAIIGNILMPCSETSLRVEEYKPIVVYMGALVPHKGFHILAEQWKKIVKSVPDAELHVIGGADLYDANVQMGSYGVASEEYEKYFIKYLTDSDGKLLPSVFFHGVMGNDKKKILRMASVGVPNPSGSTETFCNVAVEMQDTGIPVVTIAKNSFFDVVSDKRSGYLYTNIFEFREKIIKLLQNKELNMRMGNYGHEYVKRFYPDQIMPKWERLFEDVMSDNSLSTYKIHGHIFRNRKINVIINAFLRRTMNLRGITPINQRKKINIVHKVKKMIKYVLLKDN